MYASLFLNSIAKFGSKKWLLYVRGYLCACFSTPPYGFSVECASPSVDFAGSSEKNSIILSGIDDQNRYC